jgi:ubiquinone/menaquinone biosynthesis C-methylase UbiE
MTSHQHSRAASQRDEFRRQLHLQRELCREMGALVPPSIDLSTAQCVLDVACGAGGWLLEMARAFPHIQFIGLNTSEDMLERASEQASQEGVKKTIFLEHTMANIDQLPFSHATFDLINIAFIARYLLTLDYAALARSLYPFSRPGGTLCWTECELPVTNSVAFESLMAKTCQALQAAGHTFIPSSMQEIAAIFERLVREAGHEVRPYQRRRLGITPMLGNWMRQAGYQNIRHTAYAIEISAGMPARQMFLQEVEVYAQRIRPFLLATEVISEADFDELVSRLQSELHEERFCGLCFVLQVWGQKP